MMTVLAMQKTRRRPYPLAIEREYSKALTKAVRQMVKVVSNRVDELTASVRFDAFDAPQSTGNDETVRQWILSLQTEVIPVFDVAIAYAGKAGLDVSKFTDKQLLKLLKQHYGVDIFPGEPDLLELLTQFEAENIRLIKSIPDKYFEQLYGKVVNTLRAGTNKTGLIEVIRQSTPAPKKRAKLIARDQIGKIDGNLTRLRQQGIGVTEYDWRTAKDERVRGNPAGKFKRAKYSHYHREGKRYKWSKPPKDGHPGHPINCRCYAQPVLQLLQDLKEVIIAPTL